MPLSSSPSRSEPLSMRSWVIGSGMIQSEDILKLPLGTRLYGLLRRLPLIRSRLT